MRFIVAYALAPLAPGLLLELAALAGWFRHGAGLTASLYVYLVSWAVGPFAHALFEHLGWQKLSHYLIGAFLGMTLVSFSSCLASGESAEPDFTYEGLVELSAFMGLLSMLVAGAFWLIAIRPRLGKDSLIGERARRPEST